MFLTHKGLSGFTTTLESVCLWSLLEHCHAMECMFLTKHTLRRIFVSFLCHFSSLYNFISSFYLYIVFMFYHKCLKQNNVYIKSNSCTRIFVLFYFLVFISFYFIILSLYYFIFF